MTNQDKMRADFAAWSSKWSYGVLDSDDDAGRVSRLGAWAAWQAADVSKDLCATGRLSSSACSTL